MANGPTKTQLLTNLSEACELSKAQISAVLDALKEEIRKALAADGQITIPGLLKIKKKEIPARPARKGVPNPFKPGELMDVPAKPASTKLKVLPLKGLKDLI